MIIKIIVNLKYFQVSFIAGNGIMNSKYDLSSSNFFVMGAEAPRKPV